MSVRMAAIIAQITAWHQPFGGRPDPLLAARRQRLHPLRGRQRASPSPARSGLPESNGGRRVIFERELDQPGMRLAADRGGEREREVDAGGDAAAGDAVAVEDDALGDRLGAEQGEMLAPGPVAGGAIAAEQPGGAEDQRAGADAGHPLRALADAARPRRASRHPPSCRRRRCRRARRLCRPPPPRRRSRSAGSRSRRRSGPGRGSSRHNRPWRCRAARGPGPGR